MTTLYWIFEFTKVLLFYLFIMFVWPSVIFRSYLRKKSRTFRFCFCVTVQVVIINTVVLGFGLLHILNVWTINLVLYGTLLYSIREKLFLKKNQKKGLQKLLAGTYGLKQFFLRTVRALKQQMILGIRKAWRSLHGKMLEYGLLFVVLAYGVFYFSYGALQDYSYGFGDMYVHHAWIYGLMQGEVFQAGVYPEGMHCVVYLMHMTSGIRLYSCLLFLGGIHSLVFLLSAYCLMKEIFRWRYTPILVLVIFLTIDLNCIDEVFSMSRLQWTLPQEYGLYTQFLCALFLFRYLKGRHGKYKRKRGEPRTKLRRIWVWNEDLLLFAASLTASFAVHFYTTIMAFFLCLLFALFQLRSIFSKEHFVPLLAAAFGGIIVAATPMVCALISGIPFQGSIGWAMSVIEGTGTEEGRTQQAQNQNQNQNQSFGQTQTPISPSGETGTQSTSGQTGGVTVPEKSLFDKGKEFLGKVWKFAGGKLTGIYKFGYRTLYEQSRAVGLVVLSGLALILWFVYRCIHGILCRGKARSTIPGNYFDGYPPMVCASVVFMILYAAPFIGLPELIAGSRLCSTEHMLLIVVVAMPADMLFSLLRQCCKKDMVLQLISAGGCIAVYLVILVTGNLHGYLYYELTRYNAAVDVTNNIIEELPQNTYTVVSPTDELYPLIQYGRHEELVTFLRNLSKAEYYLPTEYVFLFVEKNPLKYAQSHFFAGPFWLAEEKYPSLYNAYFSQCPEIMASHISTVDAMRPMRLFAKESQMYSDLESRTILESKMYEWCKKFSDLYGNELKVYYEDEDFVCYYFRQNPQFLYNLTL